MMDKHEPVRIELTEDQKQQILEATGKDASAIELTVEELEERVSPRRGVEPRSPMA
jgi:hypothetical protein